MVHPLFDAIADEPLPKQHVPAARMAVKSLVVLDLSFELVQIHALDCDHRHRFLITCHGEPLSTFVEKLAGAEGHDFIPDSSVVHVSPSSGQRRRTIPCCQHLAHYELGSESERAIPRPDEITSTPFDGAARRLVVAIGAEGRQVIAPKDYELVLRTLAGFAHRFGIPRSDAEELAAESVEELFLRRGGASQIRRPAAYLFWTMRNRIVDSRRRARVREAAETLVDSIEAHGRYYSEEDDAITRLLDGQVTTEVVQDALRAASAAGDDLLVRIVTTWITVAGELGEAPSSRDVGPRAEVSHTSVNQALRRLRNYLPEPSDQAWHA